MQAFLDTKPLSLAELPRIDDALRAFRQHILDYQTALNDEGIWLFLSTVGCWGVPQPGFQMTAYFVTVMMFGSRLASRYTERRPFKTLASDLQRRIQQVTPSAEERTRQLLLLQQLQKAYLSGIRPLLASKVFAVAWTFYGASFVYALAQRFPSLRI